MGLIQMKKNYTVETISYISKPNEKSIRSLVTIVYVIFIISTFLLTSLSNKEMLTAQVCGLGLFFYTQYMFRRKILKLQYKLSFGDNSINIAYRDTERFNSIPFDQIVGYKLSPINSSITFKLDGYTSTMWLVENKKDFIETLVYYKIPKL